MGEFKPSICRFCHAQCAILVEMEDGQPVKVIGDKDNPVYHGYTCIKGRELPNYHRAPDRLLTSMKRQPDGGHAPVASAQAIAEVADRLKHILDEHGPRAIALYIGTHGFNNLASSGLAMAWLQALGSPMLFTSVTIDQPGKAVSTALHGSWLAGAPSFHEADAWMLIGTNPIVSMNGLPGNPARAIRKAKQRGQTLVVIDPRESDVARQADIFLQPRPGCDPILLAGLIRVVLTENLRDHAFITDHVRGLDDLRAAVEPFTPDVVAERAGVPADALVAAARAYAGAARAGINIGTGPNMSGHGNLTEYLAKALMSVCGHWLQEGERLPNPGVLLNRPPAIAQATDPMPAWGFGEELRVRGLTDTAAGLPTAALADEILMDGAGQVRALISLGGNPMMAWPDQLKTHQAMQALDLLVSIDPRMTATARLSDYVIAPKLTFEVMGWSVLQEALGPMIGTGWGYAVPYGQFADKLVDPPADSDVIEDWEFFYGLGQHLGLTLQVAPVPVLDPEEAAAKAAPLDMAEKPTSEALWDLLLRFSPVPADQVRQHPRGAVFDRGDVRVQPRQPGWAGRLDVGNQTMMDELGEIARTPTNGLDHDYPFRLVSRRLPSVLNSAWHDNPTLQKRFRYNPAFMNPDDLAELGIATGDVVEIASPRAAIRGVAEAAAEVRPGVISMSHCWGAAPGEDDDPHRVGTNTGRLSDTERDFDPHTGIPRMSTIPVRVRPVADA